MSRVHVLREMHDFCMKKGRDSVLVGNLENIACKKLVLWGWGVQPSLLIDLLCFLCACVHMPSASTETVQENHLVLQIVQSGHDASVSPIGSPIYLISKATTA